MKITKTDFLKLLLLLGILQGVLYNFLPTASNIAMAQSHVGWQKDFQEICAKTQNALNLSEGELKGLLTRCDTLKQHIENLDESQATQRKVFLKRLKMCRDFYVFALEAKAGKE